MSRLLSPPTVPSRRLPHVIRRAAPHPDVGDIRFAAPAAHLRLANKDTRTEGVDMKKTGLFLAVAATLATVGGAAYAAVLGVTRSEDVRVAIGH